MDASALERDEVLLERLRKGDESAFISLLDRYQASMVRIAFIYVRDPDIAQDVVQETWIGVLKGLNTFAGRSSLKTWVFSILTNRAKTRAQREGRYVALDALGDLDASSDEPTVDPARFRPADDPQWPGHWLTGPRSWDNLPEAQLLSQETLEVTKQAIDRLPAAQRAAITLRDVEGWSSEEVCNVLSVTKSNQRVLLHRARASVRRALEHYLDQSVPT